MLIAASCAEELIQAKKDVQIARKRNEQKIDDWITSEDTRRKRKRDSITMNMRENIGLKEKKCKQCGKKFECKVDYVYKRRPTKHTDRYDFFCSYSCMRAFDKAHEPKKIQIEM